MGCGHEREEVSQARGRSAAVIRLSRPRLRTASPQPRVQARRATCARGPPAGVQDGRVVASAELPPIAGSDSPVSSRARYIATWRGQATRAARAAETAPRRRSRTARRRRPGSRATERAGGRRGAGIEPVEHLRGELGGERAAGERAEGDDADERALERAHVARRSRSAISSSARSSASVDAVVLGALAQDRQRVAEVGGLDVGDEPGLEALAQAVLERLQVAAAGGRR